MFNLSQALKITKSTVDLLAMKNPLRGIDEPDTSVARDGMVDGKGKHYCCLCGGDIAHGERQRARVRKRNGKAVTFRFCNLCCRAMALKFVDQGWALTERVLLGQLRRQGDPLPRPEDYFGPDTLAEWNRRRSWPGSLLPKIVKSRKKTT